jgi:hypothetical protein
MNEEEEIISIARQIKNVIVNRANVNASVEEDYKNRYNMLVEEIVYMLNDAEKTHQDYKEQGLSFSAVEMEGYLRALKTIKSYIDCLNEQG